MDFGAAVPEHFWEQPRFVGTRTLQLWLQPTEVQSLAGDEENNSLDNPATHVLSFEAVLGEELH